MVGVHFLALLRRFFHIYVFIFYRRSFTMQIFPDHRSQLANNINNQRYNPSLLNHWEILIVAIYLNILFFFIVITGKLNVLFSASLALFNAICIPSFVFYFNGKLRQFYQRQFWENAPNCLQCFNPDRIIEINNTDNNIELGPLPQNRYCKKRARF